MSAKDFVTSKIREQEGDKNYKPDRESVELIAGWCKQYAFSRARNKLSPLSNLIAMIEDGAPLGAIKSQLPKCKESIKALTK